jgi:hypothetical protein
MMALFIIGLSASAFNPIWTTIDKRMINGLGRLDHSDPIEVAEYFDKHRRGSREKDIENLGFGWQVWHVGIGGGYVGVTAEFYYFKDSIVAYELIPQMPTEPGLQARYRAWYAATFTFEGEAIRSREFNMRSLEEPLSQYTGSFRTQPPADSISNYLSPASGTRYGFWGGYGDGLPANRAYFKSIKEKIDDEVLLLMMYSINPASRLTAIEYYYYRSRHEFGAIPEVDAWVLQVFDEVPRVSIAMGCIVETTTAQGAVAIFGNCTEEWYDEE